MVSKYMSMNANKFDSVFVEEGIGTPQTACFLDFCIVRRDDIVGWDYSWILLVREALLLEWCLVRSTFGKRAFLRISKVIFTVSGSSCDLLFISVISLDWFSYPTASLTLVLWRWRWSANDISIHGTFFLRHVFVTASSRESERESSAFVSTCSRSERRCREGCLSPLLSVGSRVLAPTKTLVGIVGTTLAS